MHPLSTKHPIIQQLVHSIAIVEQGSIHTCNLLGVNYCENFSVHAIMKNGYTTPLLIFSVQAKVDEIPSVNVST